jgi:hypothetical protein
VSRQCLAVLIILDENSTHETMMPPHFLLPHPLATTSYFVSMNVTIVGIMCLSFCIWLISLIITSPRFIQSLCLEDLCHCLPTDTAECSSGKRCSPLDSLTFPNQLLYRERK